MMNATFRNCQVILGSNHRIFKSSRHQEPKSSMNESTEPQIRLLAGIRDGNCCQTG